MSSNLLVTRRKREKFYGLNLWDADLLEVCNCVQFSIHLSVDRVKAPGGENSQSKVWKNKTVNATIRFPALLRLSFKSLISKLFSRISLVYRL